MGEGQGAEVTQLWCAGFEKYTIVLHSSKNRSKMIYVEEKEKERKKMEGGLFQDEDSR